KRAPPLASRRNRRPRRGGRCGSAAGQSRALPRSHSFRTVSPVNRRARLAVSCPAKFTNLTLAICVSASPEKFELLGLPRRAGQDGVREVNGAPVGRE